MATKTLIRLTRKHDAKPHDIKLNYDDATVEAITDAVVELVHRYRMDDGDSLTVSTIEVED